MGKEHPDPNSPGTGGRMGCTHVQAEHQSPPSVWLHLLNLFRIKRWLWRRGPSCRSAPTLPVAPWDGPGRAGVLLPAPFHCSNSCPQGSSEHVSESLSAFATPLTQGGNPAPVAGKTHNCRAYREALVHFSHHFQWLGLSTNC